MNEQQIRTLIRDELNQQRYTAGTPIVSPHNHDNNNSPRLSQSDIMPAVRTSGSITFARIATYKINTNSNPNPTLVLCYGIVVDSASAPTKRTHTFGTAQLGQSYYLQPDTLNTVKVGGPIQPFIQSSTYFYVDNTGVVHALTDEENLVDVEYGGIIHARMTLTAFDSKSITLDVTHLDSGWNIIVNIVVI